MNVRIVLLLSLGVLTLQCGLSLGDDYFNSWDGRKRYINNPIQGVSATITSYLRPNISDGVFSCAYCMASLAPSRWAQAGYYRRNDMPDAKVWAQWKDDNGTTHEAFWLVPTADHTYKCTYDAVSGIWRFCYDMFPGVDFEFANSQGTSTTWIPTGVSFSGEIREVGQRFCRVQMVGEPNKKVKFSNMRYLPVGFCFSTVGCAWQTCMSVPKVWPDTKALWCEPDWEQDATHAPEYFLIWDKTL